MLHIKDSLFYPIFLFFLKPSLFAFTLYYRRTSKTWPLRISIKNIFPCSTDGPYNCAHWSGYKKYTCTRILFLHTLSTRLILLFFALENFNLPLRKDPITSHLKHPNQTPIPSEPLTDVRAETSLPTEHSVHICSPLSLSRSQCNTANQQRCSHFTDETQKGRPDWSDLANWEQYYG